MIPSRDHTGTPIGFVALAHLRSSTMAGSASWIMRRTSSRVSVRQSFIAFIKEDDRKTKRFRKCLVWSSELQRGHQSLGATATTASADVITGTTSKSQISLQFVSH